MELNKIYQGDSLEILKTFPDKSVDCIVTSPPYYGLRHYDVKGQIGLEESLEEYLNKMLLITAELKRVLKKSGTLFWNHGDSYANRNSDQKQGGGQPNIMSSEKAKKVTRTYEPNFPEKCLLL